MPQSGLSKPVSRGRARPAAAARAAGPVELTVESSRRRVNAGAVKTEWSQFSFADAQTYRTAGFAYGRPRRSRGRGHSNF